MAASTTRKQTAAASMPAGLPPITTSESAPAVLVFGPLDREYRPTAKIAGSPAPASRPNTTIFHRAVRVIREVGVFLSLGPRLRARVRPEGPIRSNRH